MKKLLITPLLILFSCFVYAFEYTNDENCIYQINVGNQTAEVVNFCTISPSVTIPSHFVYQGDVYVVRGISFVDFKTKYDTDYSLRDFRKNRAGIEELSLPYTLESVSYAAFHGLTRLKTLSIPSRVKEFVGWEWFDGNERLESITFSGIPRMCYYENRDEVCLESSEDPFAVINHILNDLQQYRCPKLRTIDIAPLHEYLRCARELQKQIEICEEKLRRHPLYVESEDGYFSNIRMKKPSFDNLDDRTIRMEFLDERYLVNKQYEELYNNMGQLCKEKEPERYVENLCASYPDFAAKVDSLFKDHKCQYSRTSLAINILNHKPLGETCQDALWNKYGYLFFNEKDFLKMYDASEDVNLIMEERHDIYMDIYTFMRYNNIRTKGILGELSQNAQRFRELYAKMKKETIPFSEDIIKLDPKAHKEYIKNSKYFANTSDFFEAYVSYDYKNILKQHKSKKDK